MIRLPFSPSPGPVKARRQVPPYLPISFSGLMTIGSSGTRCSTGGSLLALTRSAHIGASPSLSGRLASGKISGPSSLPMRFLPILSSGLAAAGAPAAGADAGAPAAGAGAAGAAGAPALGGAGGAEVQAATNPTPARPSPRDRKARRVSDRSEPMGYLLVFVPPPPLVADTAPGSPQRSIRYHRW